MTQDPPKEGIAIYKSEAEMMSTGIHTYVLNCYENRQNKTLNEFISRYTVYLCTTER